MKIATVSHAALAAALVLACTVQVHTAQAHAEEADDAASIVVTGKSLEETLPQELSRYGNDVATVSEKQVKDSGAVDVTKALEQVPGLYVRGRNGPFTYVDVSLQGSRTQDVLWTMDGIRLNNRLYGGTSPNDTLPASMIERIEVLRGGESLFYGTQASAGVINVVTRGFTDDLNGQLNASVDTWGGTTLDGYLRGAVGDHRFVAYASHNRSEGYLPFSAYQPSLTDRHLGYDLWSAGLKYQYEIAPDLALNAQYQHTEAKLDNLSPTRIRESRNDRNEEIASLRLDYTGSDTVQFFLKGYFHDWKTAYVQIRNSLPDHDPQVIYPAGTFWGYRDWGGSAVAKLHLHPGLEYLLGYDFQNFSTADRADQRAGPCRDLPGPHHRRDFVEGPPRRGPALQSHGRREEDDLERLGPLRLRRCLLCRSERRHVVRAARRLATLRQRSLLRDRQSEPQGRTEPQPEPLGRRCAAAGSGAAALEGNLFQPPHQRHDRYDLRRYGLPERHVCEPQRQSPFAGRGAGTGRRASRRLEPLDQLHLRPRA
jgi:hypothetical protein